MKRFARALGFLAVVSLGSGCERPEVFRVGRSLRLLLGNHSVRPASAAAAASAVACNPELASSQVLSLFDSEPFKSCHPRVRVSPKTSEGRLTLPMTVSSTVKCEDGTQLFFAFKRVGKGQSCGENNRGYVLSRAERVAPTAETLFALAPEAEARITSPVVFSDGKLAALNRESDR